MATKKDPAAKPEPAFSNREQRRREKFGKAGKVHQHNPLGPWPEIEANPALKVVIGDEPADAADAADAGGAPETAAKAPAAKAPGAAQGPKPRAKPRAKPKG